MRKLCTAEWGRAFHDAEKRWKYRLRDEEDPNLHPFLPQDGMVRLAYQENVDSLDSMRLKALEESMEGKMKAEALKLGAFGFCSYGNGCVSSGLDGIVYMASWLVFIDVEDPWETRG